MTIERIDPPLAADEAATLLGFLNFHRDTLRLKIDGLTQAQLNQTLAPSEMTLGGMVKHLALVEDYWFSVMLMGNEEATYWRDVDWEADRDWDWHSAVDDTPEQLRALLDEAIAASDKIVAAAQQGVGLDLASVRKSRGSDEAFTLRWIVVHMVEEYARHNGHADLLRESIDGTTGE